ncbi:hypothetical protein [Methylomonas sp. AM2-LC]|uniref:hypothetical protein n=1 Tax=Methylomonas sp. AM2-LC TaxID=3153301 RepID=UPI0032661379
MSSKLNITEIILGHFKTLKNSNGNFSKADISVFFIMPLIFTFFSIYSSFRLNDDITSLLVNFGSIFTALLLSVLVLVYDQESKLDAVKNSDPFFTIKKELLRELYYNISYSIICSLLLVLLCFIHSIVESKCFLFNVFDMTLCFKYDEYLATPLVIFITSNLFLNIIMIVKRMHAMLISHHGP